MPAHVPQPSRTYTLLSSIILLQYTIGTKPTKPIHQPQAHPVYQIRDQMLIIRSQLINCQIVHPKIGQIWQNQHNLCLTHKKHHVFFQQKGKHTTRPTNKTHIYRYSNTLGTACTSCTSGLSKRNKPKSSLKYKNGMGSRNPQYNLPGLLPDCDLQHCTIRSTSVGIMH